MLKSGSLVFSHSPPVRCPIRFARGQSKKKPPIWSHINWCFIPPIKMGNLGMIQPCFKKTSKPSGFGVHLWGVWRCWGSAPSTTTHHLSLCKPGNRFYHQHIYNCIRICVIMYIYMYVCVVYIYICVCVVYIYMCVSYIYIHTYIIYMYRYMYVYVYVHKYI